MPTNNQNLDALLDAIYDGPHLAAKKTALVDGVLQRVTDEQTQAKFGVAKAALNANQKAWFVLRPFREKVREFLVSGPLENIQQQTRASRLAAEEAAGEGLPP